MGWMDDVWIRHEYYEILIFLFYGNLHVLKNIKRVIFDLI